jgi:hypothetical protein
MQTRRGLVRVGARESPAVPANPGANQSCPLPSPAGALMFSDARDVSKRQAPHPDRERARERPPSVAHRCPPALSPWPFESGPGVRRFRPDAPGVAGDRGRGRERIGAARKTSGQALFVRPTPRPRQTPFAQQGSPARLLGSSTAGAGAATNAGGWVVHRPEWCGDRIRGRELAGLEFCGRDRPLLRLGRPVRGDRGPDQSPP